MTEEMELVAMTLIAHAGECKSLAYQALNEAKTGNFGEAQKYLEQSNEEMLKAHGIQTDLIVKEAGGESIDLGLIMVHSQDHLMGAILFKDLVKEFIEVYKAIYKK